MALPQQLKTARSSNTTPVSSVDNIIGELEQAIADILGLPMDTPINEVVTGRVKYAQVADSAAISNTTTATAFNKSYSIPANSLAVGNIFKIRAFGTFSSTAAPSITMTARIGGAIAYQATHVAIATGPDFWQLEIVGIVRAIGASGSIALGLCHGAMGQQFAAANAISGSSVSIDTTVARLVEIFAQWSAASPSNTITMRGLIVEILPAGSTS